MVLGSLAVEPGREHLVEDRVLVAQVLLYQQVRVLQRVDEHDREREASADQQDGDVHEVKVVRNVVLVALVRQLRDRDQAEQTEREQNGPERNVHELSDCVDDLVEYFRELLAAHEGHSEDEADGGGQNCIRREDHAHPNLRFVALLVDTWLTGHVDQIFFLNDLLHHERVCNHDQQTRRCDQFQ